MMSLKRIKHLGQYRPDLAFLNAMIQGYSARVCVWFGQRAGYSARDAWYIVQHNKRVADTDDYIY